MERQTIIKHVFISEKASETIEKSIPQKDDCSCSDVVEQVSNCLSTTLHTPTAVLVFIAQSEFQRVKELVSLFEKQSLMYAFAVSISDASSADEILDDENVHYIWSGELQALEYGFAVNKTFKLLENSFHLKIGNDEYLARLLDMRQDQENLVNIGRSLSIEKNTEKLLRLILKKSKLITGADAGSIYIIEENENREKQIRFKFSHTFSKEIPLEEFVIPYDTTSIAGYTAVTGEVLNLADVYQLSEKDPVEFNDKFDKSNHYRSKSMLVIPMKSHTGEIIGVIQLINSKKNPKRRSSSGNEAYEILLEEKKDFDDKVFSFQKRYVNLMESIAGQAAIALENTRLFNQIQSQFEEFVKASVSAIESRDPATSGHSFRVADICCKLASQISHIHKTPWSDVTFSPTQLKELEYAALLHDFGKVYVELAIFQKSKKLFPKELENLMLKLDFLYRSVELQYTVKQNEKLITKEPNDELTHEVSNLEKEMNQTLVRIEQIKDTLLHLNEPTPLEEDPSEVVNRLHSEISKMDLMDISGQSISLMTAEEIENLSIRKGSLNAQEREIIESHVIHTYNFVKRIPWPQEFRKIPEISLMHHEKLDGSGYPNGSTADEIPLQAKIMAIADMYDALTASDRPYKKAMSHNRAIKILWSEANAGKLDSEILEVFETIERNDETEAIAI